MDLWSILLPIGYALVGYIASRMGVKIPLPGVPSLPAVPSVPAPVQPAPVQPVTPPENPKSIVDTLKEVLPALVSVAIAEALKRLGVLPAQDQGKVELMQFTASAEEGGMPVMTTVVNGFRFELIPRVTLVEPEPPAEPSAE